MLPSAQAFAVAASLTPLQACLEALCVAPLRNASEKRSDAVVGLAKRCLAKAGNDTGICASLASMFRQSILNNHHGIPKTASQTFGPSSM